MDGSRRGVWSWILQRVSAVFIVVGIIVHYIVVHYGIERPVNFAKVYSRLTHPAWIIFDTLLLLAVIYHALNGVFALFADFGVRNRARVAIVWVLWVIGIITFLAGLYILLPYGNLVFKL